MNEAPYHHGDLRNALLTATMALVDRGGEAAVSVRDIAKSLGVSRAAPYRHFADRDALLAAIAARGFDELNLIYEAALDGPGDGRARLQAAGRAWFTFAMERPGLHRLMFESDFLARTPPPAILIPPADKSWRLLWRAIAGAFPEAGEAEVKRRTLIMVSTSHGFLALDRAGRFKPFMVEPLTHDEMVEAVLRSPMGDG